MSLIYDMLNIYYEFTGRIHGSNNGANPNNIFGLVTCPFIIVIMNCIGIEKDYNTIMFFFHFFNVNYLCLQTETLHYLQCLSTYKIYMHLLEHHVGFNLLIIVSAGLSTI